MKIQFTGYLNGQFFVADVKHVGNKSCRLTLNLKHDGIVEMVYISTRLLNSLLESEDAEHEFRTFVLNPCPEINQTWLEAKVWSRF